MREVVRGDKHNLRKSANCKAQISRMCGVNDTDLCVAICRFSQVAFVTSNNFTHNLLFYFQYEFLVLIIKLKKTGRVRSIVISKLTVFLPQPAQNTVNSIVFYNTSSIQARLTVKLTVSFFDRGPSCPTDRARSLFFGFVLFALFIFYFWLVLFSLVPDCTTTQRKFFPAVKYPLFRCSVYLF